MMPRMIRLTDRSFAIPALAAVAMPPAFCLAQGSVQCAPEPVLGRYALPANVSFADTFDAHTLVGVSGVQLSVLDTTNPLAPSLRGQLTLPGAARALVVHADHAIVACTGFPRRIVTVSLADLDAPVIEGELTHPSEVRVLAADGNGAYFLDFSSTLYTLDVTDPALPVIMGSTPVDQEYGGLSARDGLLYHAGAVFEVIDVSDPAAPFVRGVLDTPGSALDLELRGQLAMVADRDMGLSVVDISNPDAPALVSQAELPSSFAEHVELLGDEVFVGTVTQGVSRVDVSDPANPQVLGHLVVPGNSAGIIARDDVLLDFRDDQFVAIDPQRLNQVAPDHGFVSTPGSAQAIAIQGDVAFVGDREHTLTLCDITDPLSPAQLAQVPTSGIVWGMLPSGSHLYVATSGGVDIFDITDPASPAPLNAMLGTPALNLAIEGDILAVNSSKPGAVRFFDVSDPASPVFLGVHPGPEYPGPMILRDGIAYLAGGYNTFVTIDATNPAAPTTLDVYDTGGIVEFCFEMAVQGQTAFVGSDFGKVYVVDISDPANLVAGSSSPVLETNGSEVTALAVQGDRMLVNASRVHLYDISDHANPAWLGSTPTSTGNLLMRGDAALASTFQGLYTFNIGACAPCAGDLNGDGAADFFDVSIFITAFAQGDPAADLNQDGLLNFFDVSVLIAAINQGCP